MITDIHRILVSGSSGSNFLSEKQKQGEDPDGTPCYFFGRTSVTVYGGIRQMKRQLWKSAIGRTLAVMMAVVLAGSSMSYAAVSGDPMSFGSETAEQDAEILADNTEEAEITVPDAAGTAELSDTDREDTSELDDELAGTPEDMEAVEDGKDGSEGAAEDMPGDDSEDTVPDIAGVETVSDNADTVTVSEDGSEISEEDTSGFLSETDGLQDEGSGAGSEQEDTVGSDQEYSEEISGSDEVVEETGATEEDAADLIESEPEFMGDDIQPLGESMYDTPRGNLIYELGGDGSITITDYVGSDTALDIPAKIDGHPVTRIGQEAFFVAYPTSITVPASVTEIEKEAFRSCSNLETITIKGTVEYIGNDTFTDCSKLKNLVFEGTVKSIGKTAFMNCTGLTDIVLPEGLVSLGQNAFYDCTGLRSVTIPASLGTEDAYSFSGSGPFNGCSNLSKVTFAKGIRMIPYSICRDLDSLAEVVIPSGVTAIAAYAFLSCSNLKKVTIQGAVKSIGYGAFMWCENLTSINLPEGLTELEGGVFYNCSALKSITIPASLGEADAVGSGNFEDCSSLKTVNFSEGMRKIPAYMLEGLRTVEEIVIPEGVTAIGEYAFYECYNLKKVTIPLSVKEMGAYAFTFSGTVGGPAVADIYYAGSRKTWKAISIAQTSYGEEGNWLDWATIHYALVDPDDEVVYYRDDHDVDKTLVITDVLGNKKFEDYIRSASSTVYDPKLAYILSAFAQSAYATKDTLNNSCLEKSLFSIGFDSKNLIEDFNDHLEPGYAVAKRTLSDGSTLVMVVIRGSNGWNWANNFICTLEGMNVNGKHKGFYSAAQSIYDKLKSLLGGIPISNTRYVITGHSQGGGVANLLALELSDAGVPKEYVFDYNFACPDVAKKASMDWNPNGSHDNMFNIADARDPVSYIPGVVGNKLFPVGTPLFVWGKFGRSYWFSYDWTDSSKLALDLTFGAHSCLNYIHYLSRRSDLSVFMSWADVKLAQLSNAAYNIVTAMCPVDMYVYDAAGICIASVTDNTPNYYDSEFGEVMIFIDEDRKSICFSRDSEYTVKLVGADEGEMIYEAGRFNMGRQEFEQKTFESVALEPGKEMYSEIGNTTAPEDTHLYVVDDQGEPTAEVLADGTETPVSGSIISDIILYPEDMSLAVGKTDWFLAEVRPRISSGEGIVWSSSDPGIVSVDDNGNVTANTYGYATVTAEAPNGVRASGSVFSMFYDVADSSKYYFRHVYWAADAGITKGYGLKYFDPQGECTREQMVMFLWRLAGQPEPETASSSFTDVKKGAYYYKAVLWAAENGITKGYSSGKYKGKFGVGLSCTREDAMTFLWRLAGKPEPVSTNNPFPDVKASAYYYKPVLWANEQGIAKGYTSGQYKGKYGVGVTCLREHMVTFLSRYDGIYGG